MSPSVLSSPRVLHPSRSCRRHSPPLLRQPFDRRPGPHERKAECPARKPPSAFANSRLAHALRRSLAYSAGFGGHPRLRRDRDEVAAPLRPSAGGAGRACGLAGRRRLSRLGGSVAEFDNNRGPGCLSPMFASAREHRRLTQKGVVVDLLDEEIRHVGARDEPACPAAGSTNARYAFVFGPLVRITGRTITQSSLLLRTMRSCTSLSS